MRQCANDSDCIDQECNTDLKQCRLDSYSTDWSLCNHELPCADGKGDCDSNSECEGSLVCGTNNCASGPIYMDCCTRICSNDSDCMNQACNVGLNQCHLDSFSTNWTLCNDDSPCSKGEGDCDGDSQCGGSLVCGTNNCETGPTGLDCCAIRYM